MSMDRIEGNLGELTDSFLSVHRHKEELFWDTRMGMSQDHESYGKAEQALRAWFADSDRLDKLRSLRKEATDPAHCHQLDGWIEMISRNAVHGESARAKERKLVDMEVALEQSRGEMQLSYLDSEGKRIPASSILLSQRQRTEPVEADRMAAFEGLRELEGRVLDAGFCEVVQQRNRLARELGHEDYYEFKAQRDEGLPRDRIFSWLDELLERSEASGRRELELLEAEHGPGAALPWNYGWLSSGSLALERDPWFRFEDAFERWGRSFAGMGIEYRGAKLAIDLVDRAGKYENGFMHGPVPAFLRKDQWQPAHINFSANAVPDRPGAGLRAMETLFHEGGHAAHFANIVQPAPCFSQEFAPTSVAFAETQSMLLDSLLEDPDWQWRYARNTQGEPMPFELVEKGLRQRQQSRASGLRRMMTVCYFEKALYSLPAAELNPDRVLDLAREVEKKLLLNEAGSPRPLLSIPHLLGSDSSCYYHGYVLATMALEQTKAYLRSELGTLVDNPAVGERLRQHYWKPGNSRSFSQFIEDMTGRPLDCDALIDEATLPADVAVARARERMELQSKVTPFAGKIDLDVELSIVHGNELIAGSDLDFHAADQGYRRWLKELAKA